jgi:uncharacterized BrkB/YihY/UPF0761 family membrane protein
MNTIIQILLLLLLAAVVYILARGLINTFRGGDAGRSQRLMRWRVALQFAAIIVAIAAVYFWR